MPGLLPQEPDVDIQHDRSRHPPASWDVVVLDFPEAIDSLLQVGGSGCCKVFDAWQPKFQSYLRSAMTNGQWPQARLAATRQGWVDDNRCQLCLSACGTLSHRLACPAT
eukprot:12417543-Karenia_brevis.AAC.1